MLFAQVICPAELRIECDKMKPDTGGTNIAPALTRVQKLFGVKKRLPSVLFIIVQSRLSGNVNSLFGTIRNMKAAGTKIYSIGIGGSYDAGQVLKLAGNDRNSFASLLPSLVAGSMMNLQFWCLKRKLLSVHTLQLCDSVSSFNSNLWTLLNSKSRKRNFCCK